MTISPQIRFAEDGKSFSIWFRLLGDRVYGKTFYQQFRARHLEQYLKDWPSWTELTAEELALFEKSELCAN